MKMKKEKEGENDTFWKHRPSPQLANILYNIGFKKPSGFFPTTLTECYLSIPIII
jgi:hypothetical protein